MRTRLRAPYVLILAAFACGDIGLPDGTPPDNQAMMTSADLSAVYVAGGDDHFVARVDTDSLEAQTTRIDGEPTRLTRIGPRIFVTLRAQRAVVELEDDGGRLREVRRVEVGPEPYGIAASSDGSKLYVAVSTADEVRELDAETLETLRTFDVPNEPRWLVVHPSDRKLYVGAAGLGGLHVIDLELGRRTPISFPPTAVDGRGQPREIAVRVTGDLAFSPDGSRLAVPLALLTPSAPLLASRIAESRGYYEQIIGVTLGPIQPSVAILPTDDAGTPQLAEPELVPIILTADSGYLASVVFSPNGNRIFGTIEGGAAIVAIPTSYDPRRDGRLVEGALSRRRLKKFGGAPAGARAMVFTTSQEALIYGFLAHRIKAVTFTFFGPQKDLGYSEGETSAALAPSTRTAQVDRGRALFYSTNDPAVTAGGISCATCHFEGRTDGVTWTFERGPRQTPSLAGGVSTPVRWQADIATVAEDAVQTSAEMGGNLSLADGEAIAAFIEQLRPVDHPLRGSSTAEIERGREIFHRPDVGCAGCHSGAQYTDKRTYDMLGFQGVATPTLLGIAATAPYFHDGSAKTLRDVLLLARSGAMGNTSQLDEGEMAALEAFLRSL